MYKDLGVIQTWSEVTLDALKNLWQGFIEFIPVLIGALIIFIIGWLISVWIGKLIAGILKKLRIDRIFEGPKWQQAFEEAGLKISVSEFLGGLIKWILVIVFLLIAVQILGLQGFAAFLERIVSWLPNLIIAAAIFVVAVIIADYAEKLIKAIVRKMEIGYTKFLGILVKVAIWALAIIAILIQLEVAADIVQIITMGIIALIVISLGLAFGLGGRDLAREILEDLKRKIKE